MSDDNKKNPEDAPTKKPLLYRDHNPTSRREFMAQGFLGATAFALAPQLLLNSKNAQAAGAACAQASSGGMTPVIVIDLAGGGHIPGSNVMVGGAGGQMNFLQSYTSLGINANEHPSLNNQLNQDMGLAFHQSSGILQGIKDVASMQTQLQMEGTIFATISNDDTANNQHNPMYWLNKAGAKGSLVQLAGTQNSTSGGRSDAPLDSVNPTVAPVKLSSRNDALNLVSLGTLSSTFSNSQVDQILKRSANVSTGRVNRMPARSIPDAIKDIISCGFSGTSDQVKQFSPTVVDPNNDTTMTTIFNKVTDAGNRNAALPITKLVLDGLIGAGTIVLGGYDYHNNTRTTGDAMDRELGQVIGAIVESAAAKNKDVVVYVLTDGGVGTNGNPDPNNGRPVWTGDNGNRSSTFMLVYKKDGRPAMRSQRRQVGHFKADGSVDPNAALTSNSVVNTAKAMVANYLALHGMEGQLEKVVTDDPFRLQLDYYLMFDKLR